MGFAVGGGPLAEFKPPESPFLGERGKSLPAFAGRGGAEPP